MKVNSTTLDRLLMFNRTYNEIRERTAGQPAAADERIAEIRESINGKLDDDGKAEFKELFYLIHCAYDDKHFATDNELVNFSIQLGMKIQQSINEYEEYDED